MEVVCMGSMDLVGTQGAFGIYGNLKYFEWTHFQST